MGRYLQPGHEYVDGDTISGASITEHVSEAVLKPTAISEQILKDPATLTDELLINDSGTFKKITLQQLLSFITSSAPPAPIGTVVDFAGPDAPDNWLFCYGQEVSRTTYAQLYDVIGIRYGTNGTTSFNLPDLRGRVIAGRDDMGGTSAARLSDSGLVGHGVVGTTLGDAGGTESHTLTTAELAYHAHLFSDTYSTIVGGGGNMQFGNDLTTSLVQVANATQNTGSSVRHNNVQPTIILNKIIRYQ